VKNSPVGALIPLAVIAVVLYVGRSLGWWLVAVILAAVAWAGLDYARKQRRAPHEAAKLPRFKRDRPEDKSSTVAERIGLGD
jgi:UPF0716 family protein affecting phage T7 exclusion